MIKSLRSWIGLVMVMTGFAMPMTVSAWDSCEPDCCFTTCNPCDPCCECPPALCEGRWSVMVRGGVAPTNWTEHGNAFLTVPFSPFVVSLGNADKFNKIFDTPWLVGAEIAYNISCSAQVYIEGNYVQATGKKFNHEVLLNDFTYDFRNHFKDYSVWTGYLGARYYFCRSWLCDRVAPFVGFKAGFISHKKTHHTLHIENFPVVGGTAEEVLVSDGDHNDTITGVSAGLSLGFDIKVTECLSAVLNFEFVASQPPRARHDNELPENRLGASHLSFGALGTEVSFPITLGLRYEF